MPAGEEDKGRAFYGTLLGLIELPKPTMLAKRGGAWFAVGAQEVHLGIEADFRPARKAHVAFRVSNYEDLRARLAAAGYETKSDEANEGTTRFFTADPFGNRIEIIDGNN
ncbi:MAG: VOC family protein [Alphaproteobacteria bacterium]|nr:VOC family protein [Alphaproteobacteria bacterium]